jgi:hypothetical protein
MLEVVTSKPSPSIDNNNVMHSYGMDLSTHQAIKSSVISRHQSSSTTTTTIRSKAMNKDYGFLSELGLVRKDEEEERDHSQTSPSVSSLEQFVDNVLSLQKLSPQTSSSGSPGPDCNHAGNGNNNSNGNNNESSKDSVLEAYNFDPEVAGDARAVARKFGLNIRVVQKWIREAPTRSIPISSIHSNGHHDGENNGGDDEATNENNINMLLQQQQQLHHRSVIASTSSSTTVNKRKNPKPNQICDFAKDDLDENGALDMVVPIKKRRLSTPTPTSA